VCVCVFVCVCVLLCQGSMGRVVVAMPLKLRVTSKNFVCGGACVCECVCVSYSVRIPWVG